MLLKFSFLQQLADAALMQLNIEFGADAVTQFGIHQFDPD